MANAKNTDRCQATIFQMDRPFPCGRTTHDGRLWCKRHNDERVKLYLGYKARQRKLEQFDEGRMCRDRSAILKCKSLEQLQAWYDGLKDKLVLYNRCIDARAMHTERFYGNDMDWGHQTFWDRLNEERDDIKELIACIEHRINAVVLQGALSWVVERRKAAEKRDDPHEECSDDGSSEDADDDEDVDISSPESSSASLFSDASTTSASSVPEGETEDPLDRAIREKRESLFLGIRVRLASFVARRESKFYAERVEVIWAIVRSIVVLSRTLLTISARYPSPQAMLSDPELDLQALEMIWKALHRVKVETVCHAIADVMRPAGTFAKDEYLVVLGGKVFLTVTHDPWPIHAWGHAAAVHSCYKCLSEFCNTVESHIGLAQFALIRPDLVRYKRNGRGMFGDSVKRLRYLAMGGFLPLDIHGETFGMSLLSCQAHRVNGKDRACVHDSGSNASICGVMSLCDPLAQKFADALLRDEHFLTIVRSGRDSQVASNWEAWTARTRRSPKAKKPDEEQINKTSETILGEFDKFFATSPYWDPKKDCFQLYVLDDGGCDVEKFIEKLLVLWTELHGIGNVEEILKKSVKMYLDSGELELSATRVHGSGFLGNVEYNFGVSYELLWGTKILPSQMHWLTTMHQETLPSQRLWMRIQDQDEDDQEYVAEEDERLMGVLDTMDDLMSRGFEVRKKRKSKTVMESVHSGLWATTWSRLS